MKTLKCIFACLFIFIVACQKESIKPTSLNSRQSENATGEHSIGEHYGGGIVFYISKNGEHGLISALEDVKESEWYNGEYVATDAFHGALWRGGLNTYLIIKAQGKHGVYAALRCARYEAEGYTDWYLPSRNELQVLNEQRDVVGGFGSQFYWSSTENGIYNAWAVFMGGNASETFSKNALYYVRPIRAF